MIADVHLQGKRAWWLPKLKYTHPGYYMVALSLFVTHLLFGVDALMGPERHSLVAWGYTNAILGGHFWLWSVIHFSIPALGALGLYWRFFLARIAFFLSLVVCNIVGLSFVLAALNSPVVALYGGVATLSLSTISVATLREREINPQMMDPDRTTVVVPLPEL